MAESSLSLVKQELFSLVPEWLTAIVGVALLEDCLMVMFSYSLAITEVSSNNSLYPYPYRVSFYLHSVCHIPATTLDNTYGNMVSYALARSAVLPKP